MASTTGTIFTLTRNRPPRTDAPLIASLFFPSHLRSKAAQEPAMSALLGKFSYIRSQSLCRVLFQEETLGGFDETLCPFDTPVGLSIAKALRSQGVSVTAPKYTCSIFVELILNGRSPPPLTEQETRIRIATYGY